MILDDKPPLNEALLEHHGIKGMRWGVRRNSTPGDHSNLKRNAKRVGVGVLAVGGVAATAYVLSKHGGSSVSSIPKFTATNKHGEEAVKAFNEDVWKKQLDLIMWGTKVRAQQRIVARNSVRQPFS